MMEGGQQGARSRPNRALSAIFPATATAHRRPICLMGLSGSLPGWPTALLIHCIYIKLDALVIFLNDTLASF
jgi:hypothetical protein